MLAYRHAFHAGNHADVLKHVTLCLLMRYMNRKDKPYRFVDTHAGAGGYRSRASTRRRRVSMCSASSGAGIATTCRQPWPTTWARCALSILKGC